MAPLVPLAEAARLLGVSPKTVRRLVECGELAVVRVGTRRVLFDPRDLQLYREARRTGGEVVAS